MFQATKKAEKSGDGIMIAYFLIASIGILLIILVTLLEKEKPKSEIQKIMEEYGTRDEKLQVMLEQMTAQQLLRIVLKAIEVEYDNTHEI